MKTDYDVIIVGAGPAGASCAKHLVDNGAETLIIEKEKLPIKKCCAGMYSNRALDFINSNFGNLSKEFNCTNEYLELKISKRNEIYYKTNDSIFCNLNRPAVDSWLLKKANVIIYDNSKVIDYIYNKNKIKVIYKKNNKDYEVNCNYLIGADGANSLIRKKIDVCFNKRTSCFAVQFVYKGQVDFNKNVFHTCINKKFTDKIFAWYYLKNDLIHIGTSWVVGNKYNINYYYDWLNFLKSKHNFSITEQYRESCFVEYFEDEKNIFLGEKNILITGEATGLVSLFGEGIPSGLVTGKMAAESIVESDNALDQYKNKIKSEIDFIKKKINNFNIIL